MDFPQKFQIRAAHIARRIFLRRFPSEQAVAAMPLVFAQGEDGYVVLFRYGVVVFINIAPLEQQHLIEHTLLPFLEDPISEGEEETVIGVVAQDQDERVKGDYISLKEASVPRLQIVAEVIARSVLLASYESRLKQSFDHVEPLAEKMARSYGPGTARQLLETIGSALVTEHNMVGRAEVTEKPELLWEYAELEGLYLTLEDEYELRERDSALVRKIDLVSRTAQTALELLHTRRSLRVEWYIVILIVVEILLTLFDMFVRH